MFSNKRSLPGDLDDASRGYSLDWPSSQRWKPNYNVPRNSADSSAWATRSESELENGVADPHLDRRRTSRSMVYMRSRRDFDTKAAARKRAFATGVKQDSGNVSEDEEFSHLAHWLDTISELYMNELDNRARWDPRWLNITRRERFEGLESASVTVADYLADDKMQLGEPITNKRQLADTLQHRPDDSKVRVIMVTDLSRFVMGALGHTFSVDPEFWFEHLVNAGYGASDSGLKLKNAVWMNWVERKTHFHHRALPEVGQRTEWNVPRRTKGRCWAHLRWGRLGVMHYLGRPGFHEDEMETRLKDGRWVMERDVGIDKRGLLLTKKRQAKVDRAKKKQAKAGKAKKKHNKDNEKKAERMDEQISSRFKTTNVYRPYSTFESIPKNPDYWQNRDLRVMAPEGVSCWAKTDSEGKKTIILLLDPTRNMHHDKSGETTPSLTFMPRAMEVEKFTDDELWRTPEPGQSYLQPPEPVQTAKQKRKKERKERLQAKKEKLEELITEGKKAGKDPEEKDMDSDSSSAYTGDSEYDVEYQKKLYDRYQTMSSYHRDRDFASSHVLGTNELICRYLSDITTTELVQDSAALFSVVLRLSLDDSWQLLSEMRMDLDHLDAEFGADLHLQLLEAIGTTTRQNLSWARSTLQELHGWVSHQMASNLSHPPDLCDELEALLGEIQGLQGRADQTLALMSSTLGLSQSSTVIDQTEGINKLTELAFLFVPLSFITAVFSMQVSEISDSPPPIWYWIVTLVAVVTITYAIRIMVRSPSIRSFALHCRATIINRFSPSRPGSAARRLNSVSTRAIAKFLFFFSSVVIILINAMLLANLVAFLLFGGLWLSSIGVALYFIITHWPDPKVLASCFVAIALSIAGYSVCLYFRERIYRSINDSLKGLGEWMKAIFPESWMLDSVEDSDLADEGINTYSRQALVLNT